MTKKEQTFAIWSMEGEERSDKVFKGKFTYSRKNGNFVYYLEDATYSDIFKVINQSIIDTEDWDHVFIESVELKDGILEVFLGS